MNARSILRVSIALALAATGVACGKSEPGPRAAAAEAKRGDPAGHGERESGKPREAAEGGEPSDLDRDVGELFRAACEHGTRTFECDECRHEVGVVRAPASLIEEGLMKVVDVDRRRVAVPLGLTGEVLFDERRVGHVGSQVEGIIKKVHVALGDRVRKGQPLLELEAVAVGEAEAAYLEAKGILTLARRAFERVAELRRETIASEKEFLEAKQELEAAEIRAEGALGTLTRLGMDAGEALALTTGNARGRLVLRSPTSGSVLVMHAVPGEVVESGESLVTVGDSTTVWVWADLYERDIAAVKRAQAEGRLAASVSVKAYPGEEFRGTVDLVGPAMDESSRTVKVRVEVANDDGRLLSGMFASVKLFLPATEEVLAVPADAVLEDEGRSFVFVHHHDSFYVRRPVDAGRAWAGWVEIRKGLEPAQSVVAEGAFLMKSDVLRSKMGAGCAD